MFFYFGSDNRWTGNRFLVQSHDEYAGRKRANPSKRGYATANWSKGIDGCSFVRRCSKYSKVEDVKFVESELREQNLNSRIIFIVNIFIFLLF